MSVPSSHRLLSDEDVYRTLIGASSSSLLQLCRRGDWLRVRQRIHQYPHEVVDDCLWYAIRATGYHSSSTQQSQQLSVSLLQELLQANPRQLHILHPLTGTILHEAIQYWCPNTIIDFLLQAVMQYSLHQRNVFLAKNLLDVQDDIGRTLLHCMVGRWQRFHVAPQIMPSSSSAVSDVQLFARLHQARSRQSRVRDIDGYTPLLLLLQTPPPPQGTPLYDISAQEVELHHMVQCMLQADPTLVHLGRETRYDQQQQQKTKDINSATKQSHIHTPLFYALLYGRSGPTIQLLLDAYRASFPGRSYASVQLSQYQEVALHMAITTRADASVCGRLLRDDPAAMLQPDRDGLTPLDWQWLSCLRDAAPLDPNHLGAPTTRHLVSRRRHLPEGLPEWHAQCEAEEDAPLLAQRLGTEMLDRFQCMLRAAAPFYYAQQQKRCGERLQDGTEPWHALHAACFLPCPSSLIRLILFHSYGGGGDDSNRPRNGVEDPLRHRDDRQWRYPLHYAASRVSYQKALPARSFVATAGQQSLPRIQDQLSPVHVILPLYPAACRNIDRTGQLPLHIAIDTYKQRRCDLQQEQSSLSGNLSNVVSEETDGDEQRLFYEREEDSVLQSFLQHYPGSLQQKDGCSQLYPWQQAATGDGPRLTTIYQLFRANPTLW